MESTVKASQCKRLLEFIDKHGHINPMEALNCLSIMRLAARISDLEHAGIAFEHTLVKGVNKHGETVRYMEYKRAVG